MLAGQNPRLQGRGRFIAQGRGGEQNALPRANSSWKGVTMDLYVLYAFLALMIVNILASLIYLAGFRELKNSFRRKLD